jgi:hypothetical protein
VGPDRVCRQGDEKQTWRQYRVRSVDGVSVHTVCYTATVCSILFYIITDCKLFKLRLVLSQCLFLRPVIVFLTKPQIIHSYNSTNNDTYISNRPGSWVSVELCFKFLYLLRHVLFCLASKR